MIRQARRGDYEAIKNIKRTLSITRSKLKNGEYRLSLQKNGFLLFPRLSKVDFEKDLQKIFLVHEKASEVIGYIRIDSEQEIKAGKNIIWMHKELEPVYFMHPHADIGAIAVSPAAKHQGIGAALLQEALVRIKEKGDIAHLFSFVVLSPLTNFPSMMFHEKHGFERIAMTNYPELFGLRNYQSYLYCKKL